MKRAPEKEVAAKQVFDEVARSAPDASMSVEEVREVTGLIARLTTPAETAAACERVRSRLFSADRDRMPVRSGRGRFAPPWLAAAAVVALLVTGLAVFRVLPTTAGPDAVVSVDSSDSADPDLATLIFPDEAVIDARLACLEADLAAITDESLWTRSDDLPERSEQ